LNKKPKSSKLQDKIRRVKINPEFPQPDLIGEAVQIIKKGGIVCFPTKCLYGLAADAFNFKAVSRIFQIKQRPLDKPIPVLIKDPKELENLVSYVPPAAVRIMEKFWPGMVTIVFKAKDTLPANLTAKTGKIGVRIPENIIASALTNSLENPITGTSANLSCNTGCSRFSEMHPMIAEKVDLILDAGPLKGGTGSTIVDVTTDPPRILREGDIPSKNIFDIISRQ